jgi:hypothetical protein
MEHSKSQRHSRHFMTSTQECRSTKGGEVSRRRASDQSSAFGRATVEVRSGVNVEGMQIVVHQGMDVRGRIGIDGATKPARSC